MSCYRITVSYNGRHFNGWQRLPGSTRPTVQGTMERALSSLAGEQVEVTASGRTDAGVSARAQVCSFHCDRQFTRDDLPEINGLLPAAVSVTDIELSLIHI